MIAGDFDIRLVHVTDSTLTFNEHATYYQRTNDVPMCFAKVDVLAGAEYFISLHKVSASATVDNESTTDRILVRVLVDGQSVHFRPIYKKDSIHTNPDLIGLRTYKDGVSTQTALKFHSSQQEPSKRKKKRQRESQVDDHVNEGSNSTAVGEITLYFYEAVFWDKRKYQQESSKLTALPPPGLADAATNTSRGLFTAEGTTTIQTKLSPIHRHYEPGALLYMATFQYSQADDNNTAATTNQETDSKPAASPKRRQKCRR